MTLRLAGLLTALVLLTACSGGESESAADPADATNTTTMPQTVAAKPTTATRQETFVDQLRRGGIYPTADQVPYLIPAATGNCDALESTTLPESRKFDKMVELSMVLGAGKNLFDDVDTAETFMAASISGYCSELDYLIPSRLQ